MQILAFHAQKKSKAGRSIHRGWQWEPEVGGTSILQWRTVEKDWDSGAERLGRALTRSGTQLTGKQTGSAKTVRWREKVKVILVCAIDNSVQKKKITQEHWRVKYLKM
ncbi:hypothetical protein Y1Q_0019765 [Alligator mississippiensis]|uniref:Uncharacterized protein n=1 Tax=Alligator mississippiensis TaxID=8496 RepID=A0A151PFA1_ALLMI|nr:hypothetical protein Y1Q_0019765 [Alligator mississippiensis]